MKILIVEDDDVLLSVLTEKLKDGVELVTAIHGINPAQRMGIMTVWWRV